MTTTRVPIERAIARAIAAPPRVIAVDAGNATTTALTPEAAAFFPSFVATRGVRPFAGRAAAGYHHLTWEGQHYLVGDAAIAHGRTETLLAELDPARAHLRYTEPASVVTMLAAICAVCPEQHITIDVLSTGAPQGFSDQQRAVIAAGLTGAYTLAYNGQPRRVEVRAVRVLLEAWGLLALLPDSSGYGVIHDVGGRTWQPVPYRDGAALGTPRSWDEGADRILDLAGVNSDPAARWELLGELRRSPKAHPEIRAAIAAQVNALLDEKQRRVNLAAATRHTVAGGLAPVLVPILKDRYKAATVAAISEAPERANAAAYLAAAQEVR
jgi:hypothetical protein